MNVRPAKISIAFAIVLVAAGCGTHQPEHSSSSSGASPCEVAGDGSVVTAFALYVPTQNGAMAAHARVIVEAPGADCPSLTTTQGSVLPTTPRDNPNDELFPITVCEMEIRDFDEPLTVAGTDITLGPLAIDPKKVLVYGDSGCKGGSDQDCSKASAWPFPKLATAGVGQAPELILHMGDYNYRGTPGKVEIGSEKHDTYDAGDHYSEDPECSLERTYYSENSSASAAPDCWGNWREDFFLPAKQLLPAAPWVFARGNHELCSRAGPGWFYLLDSGSKLTPNNPQRSCSDQSNEATPASTGLSQLLLTDPYVIELASSRVAVVDSANACDLFAPTATTERYRQQLDTLAEQLTGGKPTWLMTHRPFWGVDGDGNVINQTLQQALAQTRGRALPEAVTLSLAGHMHRFESLTFDATGGRPPQVTIGDSGVALEDAKPAPCLYQEVDDLQACGNILSQFGYLGIIPGANGAWSGQLVGVDSQPLANCTSGREPLVCVPTDFECPCGG